MNRITLENVSFTYLGERTQALSEISLTIPAGQLCGIIGRAGSGKSTLCSLMAGFIPNLYEGNLSGQALVDDLTVITHSVSDLVRHVGLVGSNAFSQISGARFTVFEEIAFGLENLGVPREEIIHRAEWALQAMQLETLRDRSPYALSGGQQQRLVLAATMALQPPVLILDEPTAQLDPHTTEQLADLLRELARNGTTVIFAEHNLEWVAELADRVLVLDGGRLIVDGIPQNVLINPELRTRGIGWPRAALLAKKAQTQGRWPVQRPLATTLAALKTGLQEATPSAAPPSDRYLGLEMETTPPSSLAARQSPLLEVDQVRFAYPSGVEALKGVSLSISKGERIALLGRNGAGKSTLVRHLNGLLRPASGQVLVGTLDTRKVSVATCAKHVGIVFQDIRNQLFARTVRDELRFGPRNLGYSAAEIEKRVDAALDALDLRDLENTHPYDLQGSQRRLVAIAAVVAMDTEVLVLDEPTAGLDTVAVSRLTSLIQTWADREKSVIVVSHDLDFCYEALDRVMLMRDGQFVLDRPWDALEGADRDLLQEIVGLPMALSI